MALSSKPAPTYRKPNFWQRLRTGNLSEGQLAVLLLLPALLTLAVVMLYPVVNVLWQSLHFERLNQPFLGTPFVGLENFREMLWVRGVERDGETFYPVMWTFSSLFWWRVLGLASAVLAWVWALRGGLKWRYALLWTRGGGAHLWLAHGLPARPTAERARWADPRFWSSFNLTLLIIAVSVAGSFLVGLPLALLANVEHPAKVARAGGAPFAVGDASSLYRPHLRVAFSE